MFFAVSLTDAFGDPVGNGTAGFSRFDKLALNTPSLISFRIDDQHRPRRTANTAPQ